jgi:hypothetical protein
MFFSRRETLVGANLLGGLVDFLNGTLENIEARIDEIAGND